MKIRQAEAEDAEQVAQLALSAGAGMPAFFWQQLEKKYHSTLEAGAARLLQGTDSFSLSNVRVGIINRHIAGMIMAYPLAQDYRLPREGMPAFIYPLEQLKVEVAGSFFVNMLATTPEFMRRSVATQLMAIVDQWARQSYCEMSSLVVFEQNEAALRLYERLGYQEQARRKVIPHPCLTYSGDVLLLTRPIMK